MLFVAQGSSCTGSRAVGGQVPSEAAVGGFAREAVQFCVSAIFCWWFKIL